MKHLTKAARRIRRGFGRLEMFVILFVILILIAIIIVAMAGRDRVSDRTREGTQMAQMHKAMVTFSRQFNGIFPKPGMINRVAGPNGEEMGVGAEDISRNTTANLYSSLIAQNFVTPSLVVSPNERNPKILVDSDYDHTAYDPANDMYWDANFVADLETGSNASYAHMPLWGKRGRVQWRDTLDPEGPVLSNRGPRDGRIDRNSYTTDSRGRWSGIVVYNDGHWEFEESVSPPWLMFMDDDGVLKPDNLFAIDTEMQSDRLLTFTKSIDANNIGEIQFD